MDWTKAFWDPRNPFQKADRLRFHQRRRWVCGIAINDELTSLQGCLLESQGAGKLLKIQPIVFASELIPDSVCVLLQQLISAGTARLSIAHRSPSTKLTEADLVDASGVPIGLPLILPSSCDLASLFSIRTDLTLIAESLLARLMAEAGKASDQILACTLHHGEVGILDAEQQFCPLPILDADRLALRSGLNIIDQLPSKDLASGGRGGPLSALPLWMLWADRRSPKADQQRLLVEWGRWITLTWLPASDGLDADYPAIIQETYPSLKRANLADEKKLSPREVEHKSRDFLQRLDSTCDQLPLLTPRFYHAGFAHLQQQWQQAADDLQVSSTVADFSLSQFIAQRIARRIQSVSDNRLAQAPLRVILAGPDPRLPRLQETVRQDFAANEHWSVGLSSDFSCPLSAMPGLIAATHGLLHIDQLPANLPWITGAEMPRILGRLTAGCPSRYRSLLIEMSDYRPPVMKLRQAV